MLNTEQFSQLLALQAIKQSRLQRALQELGNSPELQDFLDL